MMHDTETTTAPAATSPATDTAKPAPAATRRRGRTPKAPPPVKKTRKRRDWGGTIFVRPDRPGTLWARWTDATGKTCVRNTKTADRTAAERFLAIETAKVAADEARGVRAVTIREFWDEVSDFAKARLAPRQFPNHAAQIRRCADAFPGVPMYAIEKASLVAYFHQIRATGRRLASPDATPHAGPVVPLSHATLVRHRAALGKLWAEAIERRAALVNVPLSVPLSAFGKRQEKEPRYFTPEQLAKLYLHLPEEITALVTLLAETGARFSEIAGEHRKVADTRKRLHAGGLTWTDVADDNGAVTFANPKNGRARTVPTTERARAVLRALRAGRVVPLCGEDRVLAKLPTSHGHCLALFHKALEDAGLAKAGFHALRHAYCAGLVSAGVPLNVVMQLAGHSSLALTSRYARHSPESAAVQAVRALEAARASGSAPSAARRSATGRAAPRRRPAAPDSQAQTA